MIDIKKKVLTAPNVEHLAYLAALVAVEAPTRANRYANDAKVSWHTVSCIRDALDQIGFDWRTASRQHKSLERKAKGERYAESVAAAGRKHLTG